jgi:hypothetical protein
LPRRWLSVIWDRLCEMERLERVGESISPNVWVLPRWDEMID